MTPGTKTPQRTCVACRARAPKRDLVRIVRTKDGDVFVDTTGRANGRGASVCPRLECFERAAAGGLGASLRSHLSEEDIERLRNDFEAAVAERTASREGR
jgi:predicted RNA-binding protein YlxR (DUF448 family)